MIRIEGKGNRYPVASIVMGAALNFFRKVIHALCVRVVAGEFSDRYRRIDIHQFYNSTNALIRLGRPIPISI